MSLLGVSWSGTTTTLVVVEFDDPVEEGCAGRVERDHFAFAHGFGANLVGM